jgi:L-ascorbate metabolism protein UlaG (beta-lactamase superfamily)
VNTDSTTDRRLGLRFFGHSTVEISLSGVTLLTDPVLRGRIAHLRHHQPHTTELYQNPDAVLISHLHQDHLDLPSLSRLGTNCRLIVPRGAGVFLRRHRFTNVEELTIGDETTVGAVPVRAIEAKHSGFRPPFGPTADCIGFLVGQAPRVYFAGDTDLFDGMSGLGPVRLALLPVWGWGPTVGKGHLIPSTAAEALTLIRPSIAVPIHWGALFPIGLGRWRQRFLSAPPLDFAAEASRIAPDVDVRILAPGQLLELADGGVLSDQDSIPRHNK